MLIYLRSLSEFTNSPGNTHITYHLQPKISFFVISPILSPPLAAITNHREQSDKCNLKILPPLLAPPPPSLPHATVFNNNHSCIEKLFTGSFLSRGVETKTDV